MVKLLIDKAEEKLNLEDFIKFVNRLNPYGVTALHWAVEDDHDEPDEDDYGRTTLNEPDGDGHIEVEKVLVKNGADVNAEDHFGKTTMYCTCGVQRIYAYSMPNTDL